MLIKRRALPDRLAATSNVASDHHRQRHHFILLRQFNPHPAAGRPTARTWSS
jgi:hypothetical protein